MCRLVVTISLEMKIAVYKYTGQYGRYDYLRLTCMNSDLILLVYCDVMWCNVKNKLLASAQNRFRSMFHQTIEKFSYFFTEISQKFSIVRRTIERKRF